MLISRWGPNPSSSPAPRPLGACGMRRRRRPARSPGHPARARERRRAEGSRSTLSAMAPIDLDGLSALLARPEDQERTVTEGASPLVLVDLPDDGDARWERLPAFTPPPWLVLVGRCRRPRDAPVLTGFDVLVTDGDDEPAGWVRTADEGASLARMAATAEEAPLAAATLAQVLRAGEGMALAAAFTVESLAYSMLLAGPEFAAWLR